MGSMSAHREEERLVAERAADWLRRLETADAAERAAFVAWLKESPRHVREILLAATWDKVLDTLDGQRRVDLDALFAQGAREAVPLSGAPARTLATGKITARRTRWWMTGLAAAAVLVAFAAIWAPLNILGHAYTTAIGEQRAFELEDGSMIHLNAHSRVKVDFSREARDVYLLEGQAIFKVRHEAARPFNVHVEGASIQAVGTQFDVHRLSDQTNVAVIEGKVRIATAEQTPSGRESARTPEVTTLAAGETASIVAHGKITRMAALNVADATAWRQRRLVFRKQTLADIALEFNRYNPALQIRIDDEALRARQFNGVFDADDPDSLIRFLEASDGFAVERSGREILIRPR
jgi:transmembrane sensor